MKWRTIGTQIALPNLVFNSRGGRSRARYLFQQMKNDVPHLSSRLLLTPLVMSKETILILDKEFHTQWTLKTLLEGEKYIVLAVDTIERALQNFQEFEVSGLITEYRIDYTPTPEIIRELKKNFPELYVMMVTYENLEEKEYMKIMSSGIDDFFSEADLRRENSHPSEKRAATTQDPSSKKAVGTKIERNRNESKRPRGRLQRG